MRRKAVQVLGILLAAVVYLHPSGVAAPVDEQTNLWFTATSWLAGLRHDTRRRAPEFPFRAAVVDRASAVAGGFPTLDLRIAETHRLYNFNATVEAGEPTDGGRIKKTVWAKITTGADPSRIVIDTFGSTFDTSLAVYTGSAVNALSFITGAYNTPVPGLAPDHSLVAFTALANTTYHIQIGSETGAEGDIIAHAYAFPLSGGLAVSLATVGGFPRPVGDLQCGYRALTLSVCANAKFILYNGTASTLTVTPTSDLGTGVDAAAPFALAPGAVTTVEFAFTGAFDTTTPRTVSGYFAFTGTANGSVVSVAQHKALIVVKPFGALPDVLRYSASPPVRAVSINQDAVFEVLLSNTGGSDAFGCHVREFENEPTVTHWQWIEPAAGFGAGAGQLDAPVTIPAGQTRLLRVTRANQESRIASPDFAGDNNAVVDCANTLFAPTDLHNNFDFTARGVYEPIQVVTTSNRTRDGVLDVPAGSYSVFYVSLVNTSPTATLVAAPKYVTFFGETDPAKQFPVAFCWSNPNGVCPDSLVTSSTFSAVQNVYYLAKIYVQAPAVDPGYDPGWRRVFFNISQVQPVGFVFSVPLAAHSVAVRRN